VSADKKLPAAKSTVYAHTNIVSGDWRRLARFYEAVFHCRPLRPSRRLGGNLIAQGTGLASAQIEGVHLALPGYARGGPTLEIFQYERVVPRAHPVANACGIGHLAFEVADVDAVQRLALSHGGARLGEIVSVPVPGVGTVTFVYVRDPDGNIIEVQSWRRKSASQASSRKNPAARAD